MTSAVVIQVQWKDKIMVQVVPWESAQVEICNEMLIEYVMLIQQGLMIHLPRISGYTAARLAVQENKT